MEDDLKKNSNKMEVDLKNKMEDDLKKNERQIKKSTTNYYFLNGRRP